MRRWIRHLRHDQVAGRLRSWLTEPGSLTRRLQAVSGDFRVRLVGQGKGLALAGDWQARPTPVLVREVVLELGTCPVIFAHTELSTASNGPLTRWLARLGSRSLGSLLFSHPGFGRSPIEYCRLDAGHPLHRRACAVLGPQPALWARRSWHDFGGQRVLVTELLLPVLRDK